MSFSRNFTHFLYRDRWRIALMSAVAGCVLVSASVWAHGPFDSSARVTVMDSEIEATAIVGSDLARAIFVESKLSDPYSGTGQGRIVPHEVGDLVFTLATGETTLAPKQVRVLSDGLETAFVVTYPRPALSPLRLEAKFARWLPASNQCALIIADDQNRLLGSQTVSMSSPITELSLPPNSAAPAAPETIAAAPLLPPNHPTAKSTTTAPTQPARMLLPVLPISIGIALAVLGGWWLMRQFNHRETN